MLTLATAPPSGTAAASTIDGLYAGGGLVAAGTTVEVPIAGRGGVPTNATNAIVNLTATAAHDTGYLTAHACDQPRPNASHLNYSPGTTIANTTITALSATGTICIYTHATTHLIIDTTGHLTTGYQPHQPARLLDTRPTAPTIDGQHAGGGLVAAGTTVEVPIAGRGGVPTNATNAIVNLTATAAHDTGYLTAHACDQPRPNASHLNYSPGTTIANTTITALSATGTICIYTHATTHLIIDTTGHLTTGYQPHQPARLLDTRPDEPPPPPPDPLDDAHALSLSLLNDLRLSLGRPPLVEDPEMTAFAANWSRTMAGSGFRHSAGPYAENIAWHSASWLSPEEAARTFHDMWVDSPGHFRNMTDGRWTRVGIGLYRDESGWYGTHVFLWP